ncbi:MAG: starch-binding protein [Ruminococcaceae bacterium]|nr:starch-binding protein [Oscillospiraceae bacterium]
MSIFKQNKVKILMSLAALLLIFCIGLGTTYSWIEGGTTYSIQTENEDDVKTGALDDSLDRKTILLTPETSGGTYEISSLDYLTSDYQDLYLTPAYSVDGENFILPNYGEDGSVVSYRNATTNDIGTKFIHYNFDVKATEKCYVAFNTAAIVTAIGDAENNFRIMVTDGETKYIFSGNPDVAQSSNVVTNLNGGTTPLTTQIVSNYLNDSTSTKNRLFLIEKDKTKTIDIAIWVDGASVPENLYGEAVSVNVNFIVGTPKYFYGISAKTITKAGTPATNGFTGGSIKIGSATYSSAQSQLTCVEGESITLTAVPKDGYEFKGWYKDANYSVLDSTELSIEKTPENDTSVYYALFEELNTNTTTIYIEPRSGYSNYYIYAYGADKRTDGKTRITVDKNSFNHSNTYIYIYENDTAVGAAWPGTKLSSKDSNGNYYLDVSGLTPGKTYYAIVNNNSGTQIPLGDAAQAAKNFYTLHVGYNQTFKATSIDMTTEHYAGDWEGTKATLDSATGYYKMTFDTTDTGEFFAILNDGVVTNRYPADGLPGLSGELGGTYIFTADNKLEEFDPSSMFTFKVQSSNTSAGTVYINSSGTTSVKLRPGQSVKIVATPKSGYGFLGWYANGSYTTTIGSSYKTASQTVTPSGAGGSTVTYYASFSNVALSDYYFDATANSWHENDGCTLAVSTDGGTSYTEATTVTYNGTKYWKVSLPTGTSTIKVARYQSSKNLYHNAFDVSFSSGENLAIINAGHTGACKVSYTPGARLIFFEASSCTWFTEAGAVAAVQPNATGSYYKTSTVSYGGKTYYYYNFANTVTKFNVGRWNSNGSPWNTFGSISFSGTSDLYTINSNCNGGSWGYFLH